MSTQSIVNTRVAFVLILALILTIVPLTSVFIPFRPAWILLIILYIQFWLPHYFRVSVVFCLGLILDVLLSTPLGEHALALLLTSWFAASKTRRFQFFSTAQQMLLIFLFCFIYQGVLYLLDALFGYNPNFWLVSGAPFVSMFIWPWSKLVLQDPLYSARS